MCNEFSYSTFPFNDNLYFIRYVSKSYGYKEIYLTKDKVISEELNLSIKTYKDILKTYNGVISQFKNGRSYFESKEDIEACIEHLKYVLIANKLCTK